MEKLFSGCSPKNDTSHTATRSSLLKALREKKKISRSQISKLTQLSTYQVEGLEGEGTKNFLSRFLVYIKALGYRTEDIFHLLELHCHKKDLPISTGIIGRSISEASFEEGVQFHTYTQKKRWLFGQLQLAPQKQFKCDLFPNCTVIFGIVREGTVVADTILKQYVFKKDHFFSFPGDLPVELINGDSYASASVLLYLITHFPQAPA